MPSTASRSLHGSIDEISHKIQELFDEEYDEAFSFLLHLDIDAFLNISTQRVKAKIKIIYPKADSIKEMDSLIQLSQSRIRKAYLLQLTEFSKKWSAYVVNPNEFNELIHYRRHCPNTSEHAYHKCKSSSQYCTSRLIEISLTGKEVTHVICIKCHEIYSAKEIKLFCSNCNVNYYSSTLNKNDRSDLLPATWKIYHCKRPVNERMKCIKCFHVLYYNLNSLKLNCINPRCLFLSDALSIIWKCAICQLDFQSEAAIYNPMEDLLYQKSIKTALMKDIRAKPLFDCCDLSECGESFYKHGRKCGGDLYSGEVNSQKMIVCGSCKALYSYSTYVWTCPLCKRKFTSKKKNKYEIETTIDVCYDKCKSNIGTNPFKLTNIIASADFLEKSKGQKTHAPFSTGQKLDKSERSSTGAAKEKNVQSPSEEPKANPFIIPKDVEATNIIEEPIEDEEEGYYEYLRRVNVFKTDDSIDTIISEQIIPSFDLEEYQTIKKIGQGSYASIYDILHNETGIHFAMKKIITHDIEEVKKYKTEFELVYSNPHPNIVKIHYMAIRKLDFTTYFMYVVMELAESDWDTQIMYYSNINKTYDEEDLVLILKQLTSALSFLQSKGISHRDIKPQNILLFPNGVYKLSDFGEAKSVKKAKNLNTLKGTEMFMSPSLFKALQLNEGEVIHNSYKSDVYSIGLCFLYAISSNYNIINALRSEEDSSSLLKEVNLSSNYKYLISKMVSKSERERFDFISLEESLKIFDI